MQVPFATDIEGPSFFDDYTYVLEPPMKMEKLIILASQVLIPFSIAGKTHAFLGSLPISFVKLYRLKKFFPGHPSCKPCAFEDKIFELEFIGQPKRVFLFSPSTNSESYTNWLNDIEKKKGTIWKNQDIFDLI